MYRERCRDRYSDEELEEIYNKPWGMQDDWIDHTRRLVGTERTVDAILHADPSITTAADLSCGDAYWRGRYPHLSWTLGDFASGYDHTGPIEETIRRIEPVDLFFLCETIEHLDDPEAVLVEVRQKTRWLVLSTPLKNEWDENPEHYWAWDDDAVRWMLVENGFEIEYFVVANPFDGEHVNGYCFQIWGCK